MKVEIQLKNEYNMIAWTEFSKNPEREKIRELEVSVEEIKEAKDELVRISNDKDQRVLYEMRSKILKDKASALNKAKKEGREEEKIMGINRSPLFLFS